MWKLFLNKSQVIPSDTFTGDAAEFRTKLYELWFENYDRASSGSALGSRYSFMYAYAEVRTCRRKERRAKSNPRCFGKIVQISQR